MGMVIRRANIGDLPDVCDLYLKGVLDTKGLALIPGTLPFEIINLDIAAYLPNIVVAESEGGIVSMMALAFPRDIFYVSADGRKVRARDAFLHMGYSVAGRRDEPDMEILKELEASARRNPQIRHLYAAAESPGSEGALGGAGYERVGEECRSCVAWQERFCRRVPMYRKANR
jgi:hypothetical protein